MIAVLVKHKETGEPLGYVIGYNDQGVLVAKEGAPLRAYRSGELVVTHILFPEGE
jgi:hypothetical protein